MRLQISCVYTTSIIYTFCSYFLTLSIYSNPWIYRFFRLSKVDTGKRVGYLTLLTDSSPLRKQTFLAYFQKTRKEVLSAKNIKNKWKATGLWPKSIAKPLISPLLLENSNPAKETLKQASKTSI